MSTDSYYLQNPTLTARAAELLIEAGKQKATELGVPQCLAVVDPAGDLLAFARMDGAKTLSITTAQKKAITAARTRANTGPLPGHLGIDVAIASESSFTQLRGGRLVTHDGTILGAIGVGSGTPEQDEAVADAALATFHNAITEANTKD